jgi:hypothetical protein
MKTLIASFLLCVLLQNAFSQVSGNLTTSGGQPLPFGNVLLLRNMDSSLVKAAVTDEKGFFRMEVAGQGKYFLHFSSMGYRDWASPVFELTAAQKSKDFGVRVMQEKTKQLNEVVIRAQKPLIQQQTGGMVVNVESSVLTKGSSALEVLERSPGVIIDPQNNGITLNGKTGAAVMINGKLMQMSMDQVVTLLNGMSADDIEKIELLTSPPVKYDADGMQASKKN